ncbi:hypothetical protein BD410DRAFT_811733 [Rickenella mellea]|uniref:Uncharacterized protein n=1 Tax=Rickenella mellea TaxID=50990 RepID=A0A4Y7QNM7_9AGAM|nr:hypothetical protein BD410DRAFT_811733 [Rickenella mellea]
MGLFLTSPPPLPVSSPTATTSVFASSQVAESEADVGSTKVTPSKPSVPKPSPDEESPEIFVDRLEVAVSKAEIANVLASSGSPFYTRALQAYIDRFPFHSDPLDVALRKLLMDVGLPRETQQIDRVMEAFASAYLRCNPGLFVSEDHPYILAFSLIMLHTDAFNKSNKRKMSKADYIKNTKLPGISKDVLECFYDNIVFAPFIFIEDPLDVNGQRGLVNDASPSKHISTSAGSTAANASLSKGSRIDPYFLITNNMLDTLRIDVENYVPQRNPYSYQGTAGSWDEKQLHRAFAHPDVIEVDSSESRRKSSILLTHFALSVGGAPGPILQHSTGVPDLSPVPFIPDVATLKVTKVGLLNRKEDVAEGGKRATNRKWKEWSVILTGSQLLFFRDPAWALGLIAQIESDGGQVLSPPMSLWRPDELLSTKDAIAVHDATYIKYNNTLRFVMSNGRHFLLQAEDEQERNEWIAHINYASAFKTAGIRMRAMNMSDKEVELTGMAAAASHLNSENAKPNARSHPHSLYCGANDANSVSADPSKSVGRMTAPPPRRSPKNASGNAETIDLETTSFLQPDSCQLKATFDHVKADLAAAELSTEDIGSPSSLPSSASSVRGYPITAGNRGYLEYSRPRIIRTKVQDLESKLEEIQVQLDADLRLARNLAILAPFQRSSRDRVRIAVVELSKRVMQVRLDMIKMTCHKDILMADLAAEDHDWQNSKRDALKVATQTVERNRRLHPYNASASASSRLNPNDSKLQTYDELEVSYSQPQSATQSYRSSRDESADGRRTSSVSDVNSPCSMSGNTGPSSEGFPFALDHTVTASRNASVPAQDELAEEWNKTRAAKRVSLVKVPADLKAASFHARGGGMRAICMEESAGVRTDPNQDPSSR